jgi:Tfp pilus assembly protein PilV
MEVQRNSGFTIIESVTSLLIISISIMIILNVFNANASYLNRRYEQVNEEIAINNLYSAFNETPTNYAECLIYFKLGYLDDSDYFNFYNANVSSYLEFNSIYEEEDILILHVLVNGKEIYKWRRMKSKGV